MMLEICRNQLGWANNKDAHYPELLKDQEPTKQSAHRDILSKDPSHPAKSKKADNDECQWETAGEDEMSDLLPPL